MFTRIQRRLIVKDVDRQTAFEVMAIFVCPRWPSAAILDFIEQQIAPFDPPTGENPNLEPNMVWIECTVCEIFAFKLYCDLQRHSRSSIAALFDRAHTTLYSSSIVTMPLSITVSEIAAYLSTIATPLYLAPPLGVKPSDLSNDPW